MNNFQNIFQEITITHDFSNNVTTIFLDMW